MGGNNNVAITRVVINNNQAKGGNGSTGGNGGNGLGGGLFDSGGGIVAVNASIVTLNSALGGPGGTGGEGLGGGIYNAGSLLTGPATVVFGNFASTGSPNEYPPAGQ